MIMWVNTVNTHWIAHKKWVQLILCKSHLNEGDLKKNRQRIWSISTSIERWSRIRPKIHWYWDVLGGHKPEGGGSDFCLRPPGQSSHLDLQLAEGRPCDPAMASAVGEICQGHRKDFCPHLPRSSRRYYHMSMRSCCCSRCPPTTMRGQENFRDDTHSGLVGSQKQPWTGSSPFCHPTPPTLCPRGWPNIPQLAQLSSSDTVQWEVRKEIRVMNRYQYVSSPPSLLWAPLSTVAASLLPRPHLLTTSLPLGSGNTMSFPCPSGLEVPTAPSLC